ncbi:MAG: hypothetical protein AAGE59_07200 [Cyanobacteria bacterium P01_F01_bin.86]
MVRAADKALSFEEFLEQYPDHGGCYELIEGEIIEVRPTGTHEDIGGTDTLISRTFPDLRLTAKQVFNAAT